MKGILRFDAKAIKFKEIIKIAMYIYKVEILQVDDLTYGNSSSERRVGKDKSKKN
jgi:hypothetical protein